MINTETQEILEVINNINEQLYSKLGENAPYLQFTTNGTASIIGLGFINFSGDVCLWNSEDDERQFFEESNSYEDWSGFIARKLEELESELNSITWN